jgi:hypothetical protein|tara:strand:+ start:186 stop:407 length:222 start_codon:yes stop_codon:yes gene_type:complete
MEITLKKVIYVYDITYNKVNYVVERTDNECNGLNEYGYRFFKKMKNTELKIVRQLIEDKKLIKELKSQFEMES